MLRRKDDRHEFRPLLAEIEDEPLHPLGRTIFWLIVGALLFMVAWTCFGKVDVVVAARGRVVPQGEVKVLQPLTSGAVSKIMVKEGDFVTKDQVLMEIDPSGTEPELGSMQEDARQLELEVLRLDAILTGKAFQPPVARYGRELVAIQKNIHAAELTRRMEQVKGKEEELVQLGEQLAAARAERKRLQDLGEIAGERFARLEPVRDLLSRDQYAQAESELKSYRGNLLAAEHRLGELMAAARRVRSELNGIVAGERDKSLNERAEKQNKLNYLQANIEKASFVNAKQQIIAPVDGFVSKMLIHTVGGVVSPAEKLIALVPSGSPLLMSVLVQNKDIGFVARDMEASIKIDTFNFQKYGTIAGQVTHVAGDSLEDKELGLVYEVFVTPRKTSLPVDGIETPISTGMGVTAEIKVGKRRIIEFFLYPLIKYLDEGLSVR